MLDQALAQQLYDKVAALVPYGIWVCAADGTTIAGEPSGQITTALAIRYDGQAIGALILAAALDEGDEVYGLIQSIIDVVVHQAILLRELPTSHERVDKLLYDVLRGPLQPAGSLMAEARLFDVDLSLPRSVLVVIIDDPALTDGAHSGREAVVERHKHNLSQALRAYFTGRDAPLVGYLGHNQFVIVQDLGVGDAASVDKLKSSLRAIDRYIGEQISSPLTIGVGNYHPGIDGLRTSYDEAVSAAEMGSQAWDPHRLYHIDDFGVVAPLLTGLDHSSVALSRELLEQLDQQRDIIETLEAFFAANMSMTETAKQLGIHRNTLVYRLDRITDTLGLDPRLFDDAVQIRLAILFNRFAEVA